ncbi:MAG: ABC transporter permease [Silvanigrellales bacterium]|nr:ABC transporter permease [Silvanigrellales bacterium]
MKARTQKHTAVSASRKVSFLALAPLAWLGAFLVVPLGLILITGFDSGLHHYARALQPPFSSVIWSSVVLAVASSVFCLGVAFPVAWFVVTRTPRWRAPWLAVFLTPFLLNFLVRIYAWFVLLRPEGALARGLGTLGFQGLLTSSQSAVVLGLVYSYMPFLILPLYAVLEKLDWRQLEAARDLGANAWQQAWHVVVPHARPGILAGLVLVFVPMMGEYCVPRMLGGGMISTLGTQIESQFLGSVKPNWPFGAALAGVLMIIVGAALTLGFKFGKGLLGGRDDA